MPEDPKCLLSGEESYNISWMNSGFENEQRDEVDCSRTAFIKKSGIVLYIRSTFTWSLFVI